MIRKKLSPYISILEFLSIKKGSIRGLGSNIKLSQLEEDFQSILYVLKNQLFVIRNLKKQKSLEN